jgi:hypothetical protein
MQQAKIIDVTRTYIPIDPNTLPNTLHGTSKEDFPEKIPPVIIYDGYNFLPTAYGYKSYFGINVEFLIEQLAPRVDRLFIVENHLYQNYIIALTEEGIFTNVGDNNSEWVQDIVLAAPGGGSHRNWSYCVINNSVYCYRANEANIWKIPSDFTGDLVVMTPNTLTMAGQMGIFRCGSRLGIWDSAGSIAWSSIDNFEDFATSVTTLAGSAIFTQVKGKISSVRSNGDGFVIYATSSIVSVTRDLGATFQWKDDVLMSGTGVAYMDQVVVLSPDTVHYAWTSIGLRRIQGNEIEIIGTELSDLLSESATPIMLNVLENRYLMLQLIENTFISGTVLVESVTFDPVPYPFPLSGLTAETVEESYEGSELLTVLSLGLLEEQQSAALTALIGAGYTQDDVTGNATPIWTYQLVGRAPMLDYIPGNDSCPVTIMDWPRNLKTTGCPGDPWTGVLLQGYYPTLATAGFNVYHTPVVEGADVELVGAGTLQAFIVAQKTMWDAAGSEAEQFVDANYDHMISLYPDPEDIPNNTVYWSSLGRNASSTFEWNNCSIRAVGIVQDAFSKGRVATGEGPELFDLTMLLQVADYLIMESFCNITAWRFNLIEGGTVEVPAAVCPASGYTEVEIDEDYELPDFPTTDTNPYTESDLDLPLSNVQLQDGSPDPVYPLYLGALVYDTELKKWGKFKGEYSQLLDLSPINTNQGKIVTTKRFGVDAGVMDVDGSLYRFDSTPEESYVTYGRYGISRKGMTTVEEVKVSFRTPCTGTLEVQASLDGKNPESSLVYELDYTAATLVQGFPNITGRWHNVKLIGNFDITGLEIRSKSGGKR